MPKSAAFLRVRFQEFVDNAEEAPRNPLKNSREVSEAYENLAIAQFYSGNYQDCILNFEHAHKLRKDYPKDRGNARILLLVLNFLNIFSLSQIIFYISVGAGKLQARPNTGCREPLSRRNHGCRNCWSK